MRVAEGGAEDDGLRVGAAESVAELDSGGECEALGKAVADDERVDEGAAEPDAVPEVDGAAVADVEGAALAVGVSDAVVEAVAVDADEGEVVAAAVSESVAAAVFDSVAAAVLDVDGEGEPVRELDGVMVLGAVGDVEPDPELDPEIEGAGVCETGAEAVDEELAVPLALGEGVPVEVTEPVRLPEELPEPLRLDEDVREAPPEVVPLGEAVKDGQGVTARDAELDVDAEAVGVVVELLDGEGDEEAMRRLAMLRPR